MSDVHIIPSKTAGRREGTKTRGGRSRGSAYVELLNTVVDASLVLVDVGPGVPRGAKGRNVASRGLWDTFKLEEHGGL